MVTPVSPSYTLTQLLPQRETLGGQPVQRLPHVSSLCSLAPPGKGEKVTRSVVSDSLPPMDYSPPGSSVCGIFQARMLEW